MHEEVVMPSYRKKGAFGTPLFCYCDFGYYY